MRSLDVTVEGGRFSCEAQWFLSTKARSLGAFMGWADSQASLCGPVRGCGFPLGGPTMAPVLVHWVYLCFIGKLFFPMCVVNCASELVK